jgi:prepilin-type processing-associated H-X9-DG protein
MIRRRCGFTLIELLVVIGIVMTLMGLLLAALQRVRATMDAVQCRHQLRQIGIALHQYHNQGHRRAFPPGVNSAAVGQPHPRMTWLCRLLPYVEQEALWQQTLQAYRANPYPFIDPPHVGLGTVVRLFTCPSDERLREARPTWNNRVVGLTSYLGVNGTNFQAQDGTFFVDSNVGLGMIDDGASNTIIVGERPPSPDYWYGWWYAGVGQLGSGSPDMILGAAERHVAASFVAGCPPGPYRFTPGDLFDPCDIFHFWSLHQNGAHFLFGDGGVRFLTYDADRVLPALATRAGGEAVSDVD